MHFLHYMKENQEEKNWFTLYVIYVVLWTACIVQALDWKWTTRLRRTSTVGVDGVACTCPLDTSVSAIQGCVQCKFHKQASTM